METIKLITQALGNVLRASFDSDMDLMSDDVKRIISNEEDRKIYRDAIEKLKMTGGSETITLSNKETMTLVS